MGMDGAWPLRRSGSSGETGQTLTDLPESSRYRIIVGLSRRSDRLFAFEVFPRHRFYLGRRRQIDAGFRALLGFGTEGAGKGRSCKGNTHVIGQHSGRYNAGIQTVCGDRGTTETTGKLVGKQDICQLRPAVDPLGLVAAFRLQIVEIDGGMRVSPR